LRGPLPAPRPLLQSCRSAVCGCLLGGIALLVVVIGGAGAAVFALRAPKQDKSTSTSTTEVPAAPGDPLGPAAASPVATERAKERAPRLEGRMAPLVADLNGDGSSDVVVAASVHENDGLKRRYLAYSGKTGALLWQSGDIGSDLFSSSAVLEQGALLIVNRSGKVTAFDGASGRERFSTSLEERVISVCTAREPGAVRMKTADDKLVALDVRSGQKTPVAGKPACERANTNQEDRFHDPADRSDPRAPTGVKSVFCGSVRVMGDRNFTLAEQCKAQLRVDPDKLPGMTARALWQLDGGLLVIGSRQPGTRVPMVGFMKGGKLAWSSEVPARDPLEAREGAPDDVTLGGAHLFVGYEQQSGDKPASVTAFDVASGSRRWTAALPEKLRNIGKLVAGSDVVFVSAGDNMVALGASDGKQRFAIGDGD
jgi:hypothetical protein